MAASNYLLELHQRREILISQVVDRLVGVLSGSAQHEMAVAYTARSLTHHDQLDSEPKKVKLISEANNFEFHYRRNTGTD